MLYAAFKPNVGVHHDNTSEAKSKAADVAASIKDTAKDAKETAASQAHDVASQAKDAAVDQISGVAIAPVRRTMLRFGASSAVSYPAARIGAELAHAP